MRKARIGIEIVVLVGLAVGLAVAVKALLEKRELAIATVDDIESQIAALDPVTRAAVVARLSRDAAHKIRDSH